MTADKLVPYELYEDLMNFLNNYADIKDGADGPRPNNAMRLVVDLELCKDAPPPK